MLSAFFMRLFTFVLLLSCFSAQAQKRIVLTFDDLPSAAPRLSLEHTIALNNKLLTTLQAHQAPATGFVNESNVDVLTEKKQREEILRQWVEQGHDLGNHTYNHNDYNKTDFEEYAASVNKGEVFTQRVLAEKNKKLTFFRPPYLRTGASRAAKEQLDSFLRQKGYEMVPATIESSDHIFNLLYLKAKVAGDSAAMHTVTQDYLKYVATRVAYYEELSEEVFETVIPQIYLCHANDLNADNLDALLLLFKRNGYTFIPLAEALAHPVYQQQDPYVGTKGLNWIDRFAITRDTSYRSGPAVPKDIRAAYDEAKESQFWFLLLPRLQAMEIISINTGILFLVSLICFITFIKHKPYK